jgi:hypothetical protein
MSYTYTRMELVVKPEILTSYIWTYFWQRWKPSLSICCTMFQQWINAESFPVSQVYVNTLPATKVTLITNGIKFGSLRVNSTLINVQPVEPHPVGLKKKVSTLNLDSWTNHCVVALWRYISTLFPPNVIISSALPYGIFSLYKHTHTHTYIYI